MDPSRWQPFVYWSQRWRRDEPDELDTPGQKYCYTLWSQEEGTCTLERGERSWTLRPGQAFLSAPGLRVRWRRPVAFSRMAFDLMARRRQRAPGGHPRWEPLRWHPQPSFKRLVGLPLAGRIPDEHLPAVTHLLSMVRIFYWRSEGEHLRCSMAVGRWALDYARSRGSPLFEDAPASKGATLADRVDAIIANQLDARPTTGEIAEQLGISREHCSRSYRRERGYPLRDALHQFRIRNVESLLVSTSLGMQAIATRSGFRSADAMRQAFLREVGCLPKEYRRDRRGG